MIPDFEKQLSDKMGQASLKDLMPGFDKEQEWQRLSQKLQPAKKRIHLPVWSYAAAILVLLSVAGLTWYMSATNNQPLATHSNLPSGHDIIAAPPVKDTNSANKIIAADEGTKPAIAAIKKPAIPHKENTDHKFTTKHMISNSTDCPMEISISQTMKCPNSKPGGVSISTSSTLQPGQSAPLNYKAENSIPRNCSLTVEEIEIKSIGTGEAILLDANSSPSSAQEVFSYITREKRGDILAGVFNSDCDKKNRKHSLKLNNSDGNLVIE